MHGYILPEHQRWKIYYFVALASFTIGGLITNFNSVLTGYGIYLAVPSGFLIYTILFGLLNEYLWKCQWLYDLKIFKIPNLNGDWIAELTPTSKKNQPPISAKISIHQTYSRISIRFDSDKSSSVSKMAIIDMVTPNSFNLRYEYASTYRGVNPYSEYNGVAQVTLLYNKKTKFQHKHESIYYTNHIRDTHGNISIKKEVRIVKKNWLFSKLSKFFSC